MGDIDGDWAVAHPDRYDEALGTAHPKQQDAHLIEDEVYLPP